MSELIALRMRINDLKFALGDNAGWFDRAVAAEKQRDEARSIAAILAHAYDCDNRPPDSALSSARQWLPANVEKIKSQQDALKNLHEELNYLQK